MAGVGPSLCSCALRDNPVGPRPATPPARIGGGGLWGAGRVVAMVAREGGGAVLL